MYNSILQFNEFGIKKIEESIKFFIEDSNKDIGDLVINLGKTLQELQCNLIKETLETIDDIYVKDIVRKQKWNIVRKNDPNCLLTSCGEVNYNRTYFISKITGEREYLADKAVGVTPHMRITNDVVVRALEEVVDSSYRKSGKVAVLTEDSISKQSVMKMVHEVEIPIVRNETLEKKKVRVLYIDADEDHVSLQFIHKKGDLKTDKLGRKQNTIMPKLIYLYEGIEKETPGSKRNKLVNKYHFGGVYKRSENLWDEVVNYIYDHYDTEALEKVYISGDGAAWIKTGIDIIGLKCRFILDTYHLSKYVVEATSHLGDSADDASNEIYDALNRSNKGEIKNIFNRILNVSESETKRKTVMKCKGYILNHWEGIIIKNYDTDARLGCSAEGHVSHVFSDRMSSRPLGWSDIGVDKISRLRVYSANGGKIYDLVMYKKKNKAREIQKEIQEQFDQEIRDRKTRCTDAWEMSLTATQTGKTDGLYYALKALRGICG